MKVLIIIDCNQSDGESMKRIYAEHAAHGSFDQVLTAVDTLLSNPDNQVSFQFDERHG